MDMYGLWAGVDGGLGLVETLTSTSTWPRPSGPKEAGSSCMAIVTQHQASWSLTFFIRSFGQRGHGDDLPRFKRVTETHNLMGVCMRSVASESLPSQRL